MFHVPGNNTLQKTTSHKVVIPFYVYAAVAFLVSTLVLLISASSFQQHYFNPASLALTHLMALGWGTMIILGASHQLVPVLTGRNLYSEKLAMLTFLLAGSGIPLLVTAFYLFDTGLLMITGAILINAGVILFLVNTFLTVRSSDKENVQALYVVTAACWLTLTTLFGLALAINFNVPFLSGEFLRYLPVHAHMGIVGWFLLLVIGVGSKLIPMFLLSKHNDPRLLRIIFVLINAGLLGYVCDALWFSAGSRVIIYIALVAAGIVLFLYYCVAVFRSRIRRKPDQQMKSALTAVSLIILPVLVLSIALQMQQETGSSHFTHLYGFSIFMGWITALILGMSFKTFPFIAWNKKYSGKAASGKTPSPKEMFSDRLFSLMMLSYLPGFVVVCSGIVFRYTLLIEAGTILLVLAAVLYNWNILKIVFHQPRLS